MTAGKDRLVFFDNVSVASIVCEDAPHRVTSSDIEDMLEPILSMFGVEKGLLESLTGIKARRFWDEGVQPSEVAALAGKKAISEAGIDKDQIGVLISTSVCKDYIEPAVAALVHGSLGLSDHCFNFDVGNACLAFLNAMQIIGNMIERNQVDYGLIVDGEGSRYVIEKTIERLLDKNTPPEVFNSSFSTLTLGSGAAAMVVGRSDLIPDGHPFYGGVTVAATQHNRLCLGLPDKMVTDAKKLLIAGIDVAAKTLERSISEIGWEIDKLDHYILHQVSKSNTKKLCARLNLDMSKVFTTFEEFGNVGPASLPITLAKAVAAGRIKKGDQIALMGMGSGINCSMMKMVW